MEVALGGMGVLMVVVMLTMMIVVMMVVEASEYMATLKS